MKPAFPSASRRGSALVTVMMLSFALILIVTTILGYSLNERRLNHREAMRLEARNAAEALSEYGLAQIRQLMESRSNFTPTRFTSDEGQIVKPGNSFWGGSNVVTSGANAPELVIGLIEPKVGNATTNLYYFDPADPNNEFEPLKGRYAFRFDVQVLSKATVNPPTGGAGGPQTTYMTQTLSARASPLFSHAIFYNMDLEFMPGGLMNIVGPVHTNGRLFVRSQSSLATTSLNFTSQVTSAKGLYAAYQKQLFMQRNGSLDTNNYTSQVTFKSSSGAIVGLRNISTGAWNDQAWNTGTAPGAENAASKESFRSWTSQQYQGNLQTEVHGVPTYNPVAIGNYQQGVLNEAHQLIEPSDPAGLAEVENQKYARNCGIHIIVNPSSTPRVGRMPNGTQFNLPAGKYRVFAKNGDELILPGQPSYGIDNATINPATRLNSPIAATPARPIVLIKPAQMTDMRRTQPVLPTQPDPFQINQARSTTNQYSPRVLDIIEIDLTELKKAVDYNVNGLPNAATPNPIVDRYYATGAPPVTGTASNSLAWTSYIYNPGATPSYPYNLTAANAIYNYVGGTVSAFVTGTWNGGVYIQSVDASSRRDSGVRLINGRGRLPSATAGTTGLTIATNDALYVLGHYNADGTIDSSTGATSSARAIEAGETPCSVICDAFTILSQPLFTLTTTSGVNYFTQTSGWNDKLSDHACDLNSTWSANWRTTPPSNSNAMDGNTNAATFPRDPIDPASAPASGDTLNSSGTAVTRTTKFLSSSTELSTAIMTGLVPSPEAGNGFYSGGAHNFPRFLENNSSGTQRVMAIRGSLVAMYDSTVAVEPWSLRVYDAPIRLWGFNDLFARGEFPPLTPKVMSYRRVEFKNFKKSDYENKKTEWGL